MALLSLLALAVGLNVLATYLAPLIPLLVTAVALSGVLLWIFRRPYR